MRGLADLRYATCAYGCVPTTGVFSKPLFMYSMSASNGYQRSVLKVVESKLPVAICSAHNFTVTS